MPRTCRTDRTARATGRSGGVGVRLVGRLASAPLLAAVLLVASAVAETGAHTVQPAVPGATVTAVRSALQVAVALHELAEELRPISYRLPVDAPVVRPFEEHDLYGPGHRGVDLDAPPGMPVRAAERGRVRHAGQVAGVVWVSIDHEDGVRTSYGPLTALRVAAGDDVARGDILGLVAASHHGDADVDRGLHLGARRDGVHLDPMRLPGIGAPRPTLVGEGGWRGAGHAVTPYQPWAGGRVAGVLTTPSPPATSPGYAVPPNANHLVLVAGLSSTSGVELIDPAHLGIGAGSVTRFSYVGTGLPYGAEDTWQGVEAAALRLQAQLREQARRQPGRAVDLVGHSLGGVVIAYYLLHLHDPWDITLPPIGHIVTIASPLHGSDLARAGVALVDAPGAGPLLRGAWEAAGSVPGVLGDSARSLSPDAPSLRDVATASQVLRELSRAWDDANLRAGVGPLAAGTRVLNIVASLDGLVGADRAALDDAERRVLPGTHASVLATEAVREVVWRFLAGREVVQSPGLLATHAGGWYGTGLTAVGAFAGELDAARDLPLPPFPRTSLRIGATRGW
jgi:hypothetical protein